VTNCFYKMAVYTLFALTIYGRSFAGDIPKGMEPIFRGIEKGKPFHPIWPPIVGQNLVGTIVIAKAPGKPEAYFESIEKYRNPAYIGEFSFIAPLGFVGGTLTQTHSLGVNAAFTQLDAISNAMKTGAKASNLVGKTADQNSTSDTSGTQQTATTGGGMAAVAMSNPTVPCGSNSTETGQSEQGSTPDSGATTSSDKGKDKSKNSSSSSDQGQKATTPTQGKGNSTGISFDKFSNATVQVCGLAVLSYSLETLTNIQNGQALNSPGNTLLSPTNTGWIVNTALVASSLEYTLSSSTAVDAGFFAKLVAWIPGVSVHYKGANTVVIRTTAPLTIGYKLWKQGIPMSGAGASEFNPGDTGADADEINKKILLVKDK